jgi:hypothetical protein
MQDRGNQVDLQHEEIFIHQSIRCHNGDDALHLNHDRVHHHDELPIHVLNAQVLLFLIQNQSLMFKISMF